MQLYYLPLRREHPPQGKHNALQKAAYTGIVALGAISVVSGFATVWIFIGFTLLHVALVFLADPASFRAMSTGWYRGRFPSHD